MNPFVEAVYAYSDEIVPLGLIDRVDDVRLIIDIDTGNVTKLQAQRGEKVQMGEGMIRSGKRYVPAFLIEDLGKFFDKKTQKYQKQRMEMYIDQLHGVLSKRDFEKISGVLSEKFVKQLYNDHLRLSKSTVRIDFMSKNTRLFEKYKESWLTYVSKGSYFSDFPKKLCPICHEVSPIGSPPSRIKQKMYITDNQDYTWGYTGTHVCVYCRDEFNKKLEAILDNWAIYTEKAATCIWTNSQKSKIFDFFDLKLKREDLLLLLKEIKSQKIVNEPPSTTDVVHIAVLENARETKGTIYASHYETLPLEMALGNTFDFWRYQKKHLSKILTSPYGVLKILFPGKQGVKAWVYKEMLISILNGKLSRKIETFVLRNLKSKSYAKNTDIECKVLFHFVNFFVEKEKRQMDTKSYVYGYMYRLHKHILETAKYDIPPMFANPQRTLETMSRKTDLAQKKLKRDKKYGIYVKFEKLLSKILQQTKDCDVKKLDSVSTWKGYFAAETDIFSKSIEQCGGVE